VVVGYGVTVPEGSLPVFSVDTEDEARKLMVTACSYEPRTEEYVARELLQEQTLDNLALFSQRLAYTWFDLMGKDPERSKAK
jgi:hypothetical protein